MNSCSYTVGCDGWAPGSCDVGVWGRGAGCHKTPRSEGESVANQWVFARWVCVKCDLYAELNISSLL